MNFLHLILFYVLHLISRLHTYNISTQLTNSSPFYSFLLICNILCFSSYNRPTFKTATTTTRTQLKQQLQREQLADLERREAEKRSASINNDSQLSSSSSSVKVPLQSIGVDVPPQVLQVIKNMIHVIEMIYINTIFLFCSSFSLQC